MRAAVLSVGSELLRGDILDTNAQFLTRELSRLGFSVRFVMQVGDELADLTRAVEGARLEADVVVLTGGLGPTQDDLTREAIAAAVGEELEVDPALVMQIEARFASLRRHMPASNVKQATVIPSSQPIENPNGTAPGWFVRRDATSIVAMPGPPGEMRPMWEKSVRPVLAGLGPGHVATLSLLTFGIGESALEHQIEDIIRWRPEVTVATYAKQSGVEVHVTATGDSTAHAAELLREAESMLRDRLGQAVFGTENATLSSAIGPMLIERGWWLAVMESASGGELSSLITDTPGSSEYFRGGIVAYTPRVKRSFGVDPSVLERHGVISGETATAMAAAARRRLDADVAIGLTGVAGTEAVEGKPRGTCFIAVNADGTQVAREIHRPGRREDSKRYFAQCGLDLLRRTLAASTRVPT